MADAYIEMRQGQKSPVYVSLAGSGDLTILAIPAPSVTLFDTDEEIVSGFNGIPATGYDVSPATEVNLWFNLDTAGLLESWYDLQFNYSVSAEDGMTRKEVSVVTILLRDPLVD